MMGKADKEVKYWKFSKNSLENAYKESRVRFKVNPRIKKLSSDYFNFHLTP